MPIQKMRAGYDHSPRSLKIVLRDSSLEQTQRSRNDQESSDRDTDWQAASMHRKTTAMCAKGDAGGDDDHGPVHPCGIEPSQPNGRQGSQQ
jgi:hypothetical protein